MRLCKSRHRVGAVRAWFGWMDSLKTGPATSICFRLFLPSLYLNFSERVPAAAHNAWGGGMPKQTSSSGRSFQKKGCFSQNSSANTPKSNPHASSVGECMSLHLRWRSISEMHRNEKSHFQYPELFHKSVCSVQFPLTSPTKTPVLSERFVPSSLLLPFSFKNRKRKVLQAENSTCKGIIPFLARCLLSSFCMQSQTDAVYYNIMMEPVGFKGSPKRLFRFLSHSDGNNLLIGSD